MDSEPVPQPPTQTEPQDVHHPVTVELDPLASLEAAMSSGMSVTSRPADPNKPHPRFSMYKTSAKLEDSQLKRREKILKEQKNRRDDFLNHARNLAAGDFDEDEDAEDDDGSWDEYHGKPRKLLKSYKNQLMQSEWLIDVGEDFASEWCMVPSPVGRRALVVAGNGWTHNYNRHGRWIKRFRSLLPGGNFKTAHHITILDCIHIPESKTYHVLDVMMWQGHSFYGCETEFRAYWVKTKLEENPSLCEISRENAVQFKALPRVPCNQEAMTSFMASTGKEGGFAEKIDGMLFYHNKVHYLPGYTPLVGWLKPWMLPEMLNVPIQQSHAEETPVDFLGTLKYVEDFKASQKERIEKKREERRKRRSNEGQKQEKMEDETQEGATGEKEEIMAQ